MITGFNTDIRHAERVYHVQTEDRGIANPVVESLVYVGGEILLSKKSPYGDLIKGDRVDEKALKEMMDLQHRRIIEAIHRGRLDGGKPPDTEWDDDTLPSNASRVSPAAVAAVAAILSAPREPLPGATPEVPEPAEAPVPRPPARAAAPAPRTTSPPGRVAAPAPARPAAPAVRPPAPAARPATPAPAVPSVPAPAVERAPPPVDRPAEAAVRPAKAPVKTAEVPSEVVTKKPAEVPKPAEVAPKKRAAVADVPVELETRPGETEAKPEEVAPKQVEAPKPVEVEAKPVEVAPKPVEVEAKPVEVASTPVEVASKPVEVVAQPAEVAPKPAEVQPKIAAAVVSPLARAEAESGVRSLDQVIVDYLASEAASEHLELALMAGGDLVAGESVSLLVRATTSLTEKPVAGAHVSIRVVSTVKPPQVLFRGVTGNDGLAKATCTLPEAGTGNAALIIAASSSLGNNEVKQLIKKKKGP